MKCSVCKSNEGAYRLVRTAEIRKGEVWDLYLCLNDFIFVANEISRTMLNGGGSFVIENAIERVTDSYHHKAEGKGR